MQVQIAPTARAPVLTASMIRRGFALRIKRVGLDCDSMREADSDLGSGSDGKKPASWVKE